MTSTQWRKLRTVTVAIGQLHHDDCNETNYVVNALCKAVDCLSTQEATDIATEAKAKGVAVVGKWRLELAEFYQDRIQTFGLTATVERG